MSELLVWKVRYRNGETCHFGERATAIASARDRGVVEEVRLRTLDRSIGRDAEYWAERVKAEFAASLEHKLRQARMSKRDLALRLGTSLSQINRVLQGKENLTIETLAKVAEAVGASLQVQLDE